MLIGRLSIDWVSRDDPIAAQDIVFDWHWPTRNPRSGWGMRILRLSMYWHPRLRFLCGCKTVRGCPHWVNGRYVGPAVRD